MKSMKKKIFGFVFVCLFSAGGLQAQTPEAIKQSGDAFASKMLESLPLYAGLGLNWSDASIGQITNIPPHFGVGMSMGAVLSKDSVLKDFVKLVGGGDPHLTDFGVGILPPVTIAELRIGGIFANFDLGVKVGLPVFTKFGYDNKLIGADMRFALFKINRVKMSLGFGYNYLYGSYNQDFDGKSIELNWETSSVNMKLQCSVDAFVITPYFGAGGQYYWNSNVNYKFTSIDLPEPIEGGANTASDLEPYLFGGFSLNLSVVRLDFSILSNIPKFDLASSVGLRVQI